MRTIAYKTLIYSVLIGLGALVVAFITTLVVPYFVAVVAYGIVSPAEFEALVLEWIWGIPDTVSGALYFSSLFAVGAFGLSLLVISFVSFFIPQDELF